MAVYAIPDEKLTAIADAIRLKRDIATPMSIDDMPLQIRRIETGGGLPTGFQAIAMGTYTLNSDTMGSASFTVTHNLNAVPDMFLFYASPNIATTYSMIYAFRSTKFGWRATNYLNHVGYHGNSTTTLTETNVTTSYGIKSLTATQATITSYSTSSSYGWRAGTYEWIAIKFN